jgi:hypothetical protein
MRGFAEAYREAQDTTSMSAVPPPRDGHAICASCLALAHYWSTPELSSVELGDEPYSLLVFRCICACRCPAVLATTATGGRLPHDRPREVRP